MGSNVSTLQGMQGANLCFGFILGSVLEMLEEKNRVLKPPQPQSKTRSVFH